MANLTIVVDVRDDQTMSTYKIPPNGKLTFQNASNIDSLVISPKDGDPPLPLCKGNGSTTVPPIGKGQSHTVDICKDAAGEFLYTAQIGTAAPEDPIVIIERKMNFVFDPASFVFGAVVAAVVTYLVLRSIARKMRPQQG